MDLETLTSTDTAVMEVVHPGTGAVLTQDDGTTPITITLAGQDSAQVRSAERRISNRRLTSSAAGRRMTLTAEGIEADGIQTIVAATVAWSGISFAGQARDCTPETAREAYQRLPWLREQAEAFVRERAHFLKGSPST